VADSDVRTAHADEVDTIAVLIDAINRVDQPATAIMQRFELRQPKPDSGSARWR
jgi:hypothetical protein